MRYLIVCLFIFFAGVVSYSFAAKVRSEDAQKVAVNWKVYIHSQHLKSNNYSLRTTNNVAKTTTSVYGGINTYYTFTFVGGGFVIVAADDNINPILAYSDTDSIPENIDNENIKYWLNKYNLQIYRFIDLKIENKTAKTQWNNILNSQFSILNSQIVNLKSSNSVGPLLTTIWNQDCYYNTSCPIDKNGPCSHVVTGCVATALAQIMKYNNCPAKGTGSFSYLDSIYGTLNANFGNTTYNWTKMPNNVISANTAVATLMYQCGVAVDMQYSPYGSSSDGQSAVNALKKYFGYSSASLITKSNYSESSWENTIKGNLDLSLPLYYEGVDISLKEGHAFVCDGYENSDYFHFNWGWSGTADGYFLLSALNPDPDPQYNFSSYEAAIINIIPAYTISGTILYDNTAETPLSEQKVVLTNISNLSRIQTATTDDNGSYSFSNVLSGSYTIAPQINEIPGGFNPIDALLCNKFLNKTCSFTDPLLQSAVDVNSEKNVSLSDAVLINQRYTGVISSFPQPDWTYLQDTITVFKTGIIHNCKVVCSGDVNGSYDFTVQRLTDFSLDTNTEKINIQINKEFEVPVYINDTANIGALGLLLTFSDTMFQIVDVDTSKTNIKGLVYKVNGNKVNIAWSADKQSYKLQPSVPLFYLKIICKGLIFGEELTFSADDGSLIADFNGKIFETENILIPQLTFQNNFNIFSITNYPNPFTATTNFQFVIPTDAQVNIKIYDYTGRLVSTLVDEYMKAGFYYIQFSGNSLRSEIYYYRAEMNNSHITGKIVVIK